jgi:Fe-S-cluster containining protein
MEQDLFLTFPQAVTAITLDFRGYGPQTMLFCEVLRTLFGSEITYKRESGKEGLWISDTRHGPMQWLEGNDLVAYMCRRVAEAVLNRGIEPRTMAVLCRQIFQTPCRAAEDPGTGRWGIRVETDMSAFECRQCGQCCRQLDYRDGITAEDVSRLERLGRDDILAWVRPVRAATGDIVYRIWVRPGTNRFAHPCPFLKIGPAPDCRICSIHEVKPQICRNYPVSRKHARMTGCPGFDISRR